MMHMRSFWLTLICLAAMMVAGLQALTAQGATGPAASAQPHLLATTPAAPGAAVQFPADDTDIYLPLTSKDGPEPSPSATLTPTVTITPTGTITPTVEPSPSPSSTPIVADLFVDDSNTTATQDGTRQHPYADVQTAIDAAEDDTTIAVAAGVYTENVRIENKAVHLFGGFVGGSLAAYSNGSGGNFTTRNPTTNLTHLRGDKSDSVVTLIEAGESTVDGFRITHGTRSIIPEFGDLGGGFYISGGAPTIANNLIELNDTHFPGSDRDTQLGGGIFAGGANITITGNIIRNNVSGRGGGIAINEGNVIIRNNTVQGNVGKSDHGGGLYIAAPQVSITHNRIIGNEIGRLLGYGWGGGLIVYGLGSFATLSDNIVTENYAPSVGSGYFFDDGAVANLQHELIYKNVCPDGGTTGGVGVYVDGDRSILSSYVTIDHVTIASHDCETQGGNGLYVEAYSGVTVTNSIFWGNNGDDFFVDDTSAITVSYTTSEEVVPGLGNLNSDPLFADAAQSDYHLQSTAGRWDPTADGGNGDWVVDANHSPAIDAADPDAPFAAEPAPNGSRANLGVYGNTEQASKSSP